MEIIGQDLKRAIKGEIGMSQAAFNVVSTSGCTKSCAILWSLCICLTLSHFQELDVLGGSMFNGLWPEIAGAISL